jgi:predicted GNAT superfamily acetyltransferase
MGWYTREEIDQLKACSHLGGFVLGVLVGCGVSMVGLMFLYAVANGGW